MSGDIFGWGLGRMLLASSRQIPGVLLNITTQGAAPQQTPLQPEMSVELSLENPEASKGL